MSGRGKGGKGLGKGAENPWTGIRWKDGNRWLKLEEE